MSSLKYIVSICLLSVLGHNTLYTQFGELPADDLFSGQIKGVFGETSISFYSDWVPQIDSSNFKFSELNSDSTKHVHVFAVADISSLQLDDSNEDLAAKIAFWWVTLDKAPNVPVENNYEHLVEMKLWTNNATLANLYQRNGIDAELAEIDTRYTNNSSFIELKSNSTHFQIMLNELDVIPKEVSYDTPIFMTVWPLDGGLRYYQLYTFYGHKVQHANKVDIKILDDKKANFTKILSTAHSNSEVWGNLQSNWKARFALYKKN